MGAPGCGRARVDDVAGEPGLVRAALVVGWFGLWERVLVQRASAGVIIVVGLVLRVVWLALVPTEPAVDFATYHAFAARLASGVSNELLFAAMPLQEVGYPLFLGGVYTLVGVSVVAGRAVNVLLALWLMMAVRRLLLPQGEQVTRTGLMLVALWPANLAMTSLLASENLFLPLMWTGLVFVGAQPLRGGLLLGVAQAVRPTAVVLLLVLTLRREWRWVIALWLGVALAFGGYRVVRRVAGDSVTRGGAAFSLLVGSNRESVGAWNGADHRWFAAKTDELGPEVAAAAARTKALERLTSAPVESVVLMARKFHAQWGNGAVAMTFAMAEPGAPVLAWADAWASLDGPGLHRARTVGWGWSRSRRRHTPAARGERPLRAAVDGGGVAARGRGSAPHEKALTPSWTSYFATVFFPPEASRLGTVTSVHSGSTSAVSPCPKTAPVSMPTAQRDISG